MSWSYPGFDRDEVNVNRTLETRDVSFLSLTWQLLRTVQQDTNPGHYPARRMEVKQETIDQIMKLTIEISWLHLKKTLCNVYFKYK